MSPFERLEPAAARIARHDDDPDMPGVVAKCLDEIEMRWRKG
jgi:hypothetical protein